MSKRNAMPVAMTVNDVAGVVVVAVVIVCDVIAAAAVCDDVAAEAGPAGVTCADAVAVAAEMGALAWAAFVAFSSSRLTSSGTLSRCVIGNHQRGWYSVQKVLDSSVGIIEASAKGSDDLKLKSVLGVFRFSRSLGRQEKKAEI